MFNIYSAFTQLSLRMAHLTSGLSWEISTSALYWMFQIRACYMVCHQSVRWTCVERCVSVWKRLRTMGVCRLRRSCRRYWVSTPRSMRSEGQPWESRTGTGAQRIVLFHSNLYNTGHFFKFGFHGEIQTWKKVLCGINMNLTCDNHKFMSMHQELLMCVQTVDGDMIIDYGIYRELFFMFRVPFRDPLWTRSLGSVVSAFKLPLWSEMRTAW